MPRQSATQHVNFFELKGRNQQFLTTRPRLEHINRRENILLSDAPIQYEFHIARAFELLENEVIHSATRFNQSRRKDRDRTRSSRISSCGKETSRDLERPHSHTPTHGGTATAGVIEGSSHPSDGIHENKDMLSALDESLGALDRKGCDAGVTLQIHVIGTGKNFRFGKQALELCDFLWSLINQEHHEMKLRMKLCDCFGDVLQKSSLSCTRRCHDQPALTTSDGRDEIDRACGKPTWDRFEKNALIRIDGLELFKEWQVPHLFWRTRIHFTDLGHLRTAMPLPRLSLDQHAFSEAKFANLLRRDKGIIRRLGVATILLTQKAVALGRQFQNSFGWLRRAKRTLRLRWAFSLRITIALMFVTRANTLIIPILWIT